MSKKWDDPDAWKEDLPDSSEDTEDEGGGGGALPTDKRLADRDAFIAFLAEVMSHSFRVLKPGGFALVWSIPRTSHWTATALEEAGFETRDCIYHVFGCLSEDTEILTEHGWRPHTSLKTGQLALGYDSEKDAFRWEDIQEVLTYGYNEIAYRIHGEDTDQIVSRNHRCPVQRDGKWVFELAETLNANEKVPVLSPSLNDTLGQQKPMAGSSVSGLVKLVADVQVDPVPYEGIVWCVRVPSGSFVARRAGKAFVTGNSGFPKSLNIFKTGVKPLVENELRKLGVNGDIRWR